MNVCQISLFSVELNIMYFLGLHTNSPIWQHCFKNYDDASVVQDPMKFYFKFIWN